MLVPDDRLQRLVERGDRIGREGRRKRDHPSRAPPGRFSEVLEASRISLSFRVTIAGEI